MWAMTLSISRQHLEQLLLVAKTAAPFECCGLLFGRNGQLDAISVTSNVSVTPETHFEIDPSALIAAERQARGGGAKLLGYFHSHPDGQCRPSKTDAQMAAADGRIWMIIAGSQVSAWRATANGALFGRFDSVELDTQG
jgi:proteasome lid subunit RPN8/RPN11